MHPYTTDSRNYSFVICVLFTASVVVAWVYTWFTGLIGWSLPWWLEAPSILSVFGLLYWLFNTRLWRHKWVRPLIGIPDLNGSWSGEVINTSEDETTHTPVQTVRTPVKVTIKQSWTEILVHLETKTSDSHSIAASLRLNRDVVPVLSYQYNNQPKNSAPKDFVGHPGTVDLKLMSQNELNGDYYSGRGRQTYGCIELTRVTTT